jgi:hypothetical protein
MSITSELQASPADDRSKMLRDAQDILRRVDNAIDEIGRAAARMGDFVCEFDLLDRQPEGVAELAQRHRRRRPRPGKENQDDEANVLRPALSRAATRARRPATKKEDAE